MTTTVSMVNGGGGKKCVSANRSVLGISLITTVAPDEVMDSSNKSSTEDSSIVENHEETADGGTTSIDDEDFADEVKSGVHKDTSVIIDQSFNDTNTIIDDGDEISVIMDDNNNTSNISRISGFTDISEGSIDVSLSPATFRSPSFGSSGAFNPRKIKSPIVVNSKFKSTSSLPLKKQTPVSPFLPSYSSFQNSIQFQGGKSPFPSSQTSFASPNPNFTYNPSQTRLPRRQSQQYLTKKQKDKLYDEDNDVYDNESGVFMYNVPIASSTSLRIFDNANALQSKEAVRKAWNDSEAHSIIPPSPLPGNLGDSAVFEPIPEPKHPGNNLGRLESALSFSTLSPTAQQLSKFYEFTSHSQAEEELERRKQQTIPSTTPNKIDDLSFASAEKLAKLSVTRPTWIPPKNEHELHKHEREFKKIIENQSKKALEFSKNQVKLKNEQTFGNTRLLHISEKANLSATNIHEIRKYILITTVNNDNKFIVLRKSIAYKLGDKIPLSPGAANKQFKLNQLDFSELVSGKVISESQLTAMNTILLPLKSRIGADFSKIINIEPLNIDDLMIRLTKIALCLLNYDYSIPQVKDMVYWLYVFVFNSKFEKNIKKSLLKKSTMKLFKEFKDDYSLLNLFSCLDLMLDLNEKLIAKCIELLIVFWSMGSNRGMRIFLAIVTCIIREYHFGWNNLQSILHSSKNNIFHVSIDKNDISIEQFFKRTMHYYTLIK